MLLYAETVFIKNSFLLKTGAKIFQYRFSFNRWVAFTTGKQFFIKNVFFSQLVLRFFSNFLLSTKVAENFLNQRLKVKKLLKNL